MVELATSVPITHTRVNPATRLGGSTLLMTEITIGAWLRGERERRGITLKTVADQTKVAVPLLQGLESGDLSRWPGGIYRRAFVKAYASALGLDADDIVRRFEREHPDPEAIAAAAESAPAVLHAVDRPVVSRPAASTSVRAGLPPARARVIGTLADLTVALVLGLGSAAAGSRLLWPVLLIALYYALGVLMKGTSPMVALLTEEPAPPVVSGPDEPEADAASRAGTRQQPDRRPPVRRVSIRPPRPARTARPRPS